MVTYCIVNEKRKNLAADIGSEEYNNWEENYKNSFLKSSYINTANSSLNVQKYYCDPDQTYKKGYNHSFFIDLVKFLNKRESDLANNLKGKFEYKFIEDEGIEVSGTNERKEKFKPFILRSDQFGFSAPSNQKKHPYDLYIIKSENKKEAVKDVAEWIADSRTIGGSFLWPQLFHKEYNMAKGGSIYTNRKYYVQDRVDLTLWEIKDWYESKINSDSNNNTITKRVGSKYQDFEIWLNHFGNFETYTEFFCFSSFVRASRPICILNQEKTIKNLKWGNNKKNPEPEITANLDVDTIKTMLDTLNKNILVRSQKISDHLQSDTI